MSDRIVNLLLGQGDDLVRTKRSTWSQCEKNLYDALDVLESVYDANYELEEEERQSLFWQGTAKLCSQSYWAFLRVALGYRWMDPHWHGEVIADFIQKNQNKDKVIILPRSSGKTATVTVPYPAWKLCKDPFTLCQTTNVSDVKAGQFTDATAKIITNTKRIQLLYPLLKKESGAWSKKGYKIDTSKIVEALQEIDPHAGGAVERTDPSLISYGMRGNITGAHVKLQLHDDLISAEVARSGLLIARCEAFLREAFRTCDADGEIIVAGTRWMYDDFYGKLMDGELVAWKGQFEVLKHGIFTKDGELVWPQRTFMDMRGSLQLSGYTMEQVEGFRKDPLYDALYLCEPKSEKNSPLDIQMVQPFDNLPFPVGFMDRVLFEVDSGGKLMYQGFRDQIRLEGREEIKTQEINAPKKISKVMRIATILGAEVNNGRLHVHRNVWKGGDSLGSQMRSFPKSAHDDLLDACTYGATYAQEPKHGELPRPIIVVDPAWTQKTTSDPTAIVCMVRVDGDLWILDAKTIRSSRPEVIAQEIFRMYYRWNNPVEKTTKEPKKRYNGVRSFNSLVRGRAGNRTGMKQGGFTVDLSLLGYKKQ